jgi:hypothetical protein
MAVAALTREKKRRMVSLGAAPDRSSSDAAFASLFFLVFVVFLRVGLHGTGSTAAASSLLASSVKAAELGELGGSAAGSEALETKLW